MDSLNGTKTQQKWSNHYYEDILQVQHVFFALPPKQVEAALAEKDLGNESFGRGDYLDAAARSALLVGPRVSALDPAIFHAPQSARTLPEPHRLDANAPIHDPKHILEQSAPPKQPPRRYAVA